MCVVGTLYGLLHHVVMSKIVSVNANGGSFLDGLFRVCVCRRLRGLGREHLRQLLVLQAALEELILGELAVVVLVHLGEDVLGPLFGRVGRSVGRAGAQHVVDGL